MFAVRPDVAGAEDIQLLALPLAFFPGSDGYLNLQAHFEENGMREQLNSLHESPFLFDSPRFGFLVGVIFARARAASVPEKSFLENPFLKTSKHVVREAHRARALFAVTWSPDQKGAAEASGSGGPLDDFNPDPTSHAKFSDFALPFGEAKCEYKWWSELSAAGAAGAVGQDNMPLVIGLYAEYISAGLVLVDFGRLWIQVGEACTCAGVPF